MSMRHVAAAVVGVMFFAVACAGCSSPSSELGTADGVCYLALPTATEAVHHHGMLVGIHEFTLASLKTRSPHLYALLGTKRPRTSRVCVAAFTGTFTSTSVMHPLEQPSGGLAVVVVATPSNALLGTALYRRAPLHFGHPHVG
jgi:hypothetical protein